MKISEERFIQIIEESFEEAVKEYSEILAGSVYHQIYSNGPYNWYDRTGEFFLAVSNPYIEIINHKASFDLYNTNFINSRNADTSFGWKFGHHRSFPWERPHPSDKVVRKNLFDWLNEGFTILGKKWHPGFHFFNKSADIEKRIREIMKKKILEKVKKEVK